MSFEEFNDRERTDGVQPENEIPYQQPADDPYPAQSGVHQYATPDPLADTRPQRPIQPYDMGGENKSWSEPAYEPARGVDPDAYTPGGYAYGAQSAPQQEAEKPKKKKKKFGFLKAACLVLVCALVSGAASWLVVDYVLDHHTQQVSNRPVVLGGQVSSLASDEGEIEPGETLTGNQIYNLGLKQVVGVNTAFTTNIFGQTTPRAVSGSGFIISEDGYILTNYHVISYAVVYGGELTVFTSDGTEYDASIVGYIESNDIAVIKIDAQGLTPVTLGDSDTMQVGEWVYAIGNPLGELEYSMTPGIVSAQDRVITTTDDITDTATSINMFQISAAVNKGNSGGPVYNSRGEVIGVVTAKYADAEDGVEGLGFAIPINDALNIATQLIEQGYVAGAGLGITGINSSSMFNQFAMERYEIPEGIYVDTVNEGSAAEAAGILPGDIITALGDKETTSMDELKLALRSYTPGETETITVYRLGERMSSGQSLDLEVTFQELVEENTTVQQQPSVEYPWGFGWNW